jgi:hypothetical protein
LRWHGAAYDNPARKDTTGASGLKQFIIAEEQISIGDLLA